MPACHLQSTTLHKPNTMLQWATCAALKALMLANLAVMKPDRSLKDCKHTRLDILIRLCSKLPVLLRSVVACGLANGFTIAHDVHQQVQYG